MDGVALVGTVQSEPTLMRESDGGWVCSFIVAYKRHLEIDGPDDQQLAGFVDCRCRGGLAQNASDSLAVGMRVVGKGYWAKDEEEARPGLLPLHIELLDVGVSLKWRRVVSSDNWSKAIGRMAEDRSPKQHDES